MPWTETSRHHLGGGDNSHTDKIDDRIKLGLFRSRRRRLEKVTFVTLMLPLSPEKLDFLINNKSSDEIVLDSVFKTR